MQPACTSQPQAARRRRHLRRSRRQRRPLAEMPRPKPRLLHRCKRLLQPAERFRQPTGGLEAARPTPAPAPAPAATTCQRQSRHRRPGARAWRATASPSQSLRRSTKPRCPHPAAGDACLRARVRARLRLRVGESASDCGGAGGVGSTEAVACAPEAAADWAALAMGSMATARHGTLARCSVLSCALRCRFCCWRSCERQPLRVEPDDANCERALRVLVRCGQRGRLWGRALGPARPSVCWRDG